jgi:hypothetical protein
MLITQYAGTLLRRELDRIPLWRGNHISIKDLADYFARYVYLPRLKNTDVLLTAMREGVQSLLWERETFAYADSWDEGCQRYLGLKAGQQVSVALNANNVLIKPEVAAAQMAADVAPPPVVPAPQPALSTNYAEGQTRSMPAVAERSGSGPAIQEPPTVATTQPMFPPATPIVQQQGPQYHRFHGSVQLNERIMATNAGTIMEEVVKHLTSLYGAKVQVTLEIQAELPNGVPEATVRTVTENCRTLKFGSFGFEEE